MSSPLADQVRRTLALIERSEDLLWATLAVRDACGEGLLDPARWEETLEDVAAMHARVCVLKARLRAP